MGQVESRQPNIAPTAAFFPPQLPVRFPCLREPPPVHRDRRAVGPHPGPVLAYICVPTLLSVVEPNPSKAVSSSYIIFVDLAVPHPSLQVLAVLGLHEGVILVEQLIAQGERGAHEGEEVRTADPHPVIMPERDEATP